MSEVTVKAIQPVLGLDEGTIVTVERTPMIDASIKTGRLLVIESAAPEPEPVEDADTNEPEPDPVSSARTKRVKKLAGLDDKD